MDISKEIVTDLYNSRNDDFGKDTVVINCVNGTLNAHKTVLKLGSEYFNNMFSSNNKENRTNVVNFPETSVEIVEIILQHLYGQSLPDLLQLSEELTRDLILEADKLQLTELFDKCWTALNSKITSKNCIHLWELSHTLNKPSSVGKIMTFLACNLSKISKSEAFLSKDAKQLSNLITPDLIKELNGTQTTGLFNFILSWGLQKHKVKHVHSLLSKCDVKKLPDEFLSDVMEKDLSKETREWLNNEALRRWKVSIKPQYFINVVGIYPKATCVRRKFSSRLNKWMDVSRCEGDVKDECIEPEYTGSFMQWVRFCSCGDMPVVVQQWWGDPSREYYDSESDEDDEKMSIFFETANSTHTFFKLLHDAGYVALNNRGSVKIISNERYDDCKRLLLAVGMKLYLDVNERLIKIYDWDTNKCRSIEKPPGNWKSFNCPSKFFESSGILDVNIYFYNENNKLLLFDVENEMWRTDKLSVPANINLNKVKFVSYDKAVILLRYSKTNPLMAVYSLKENRVIAKTNDVTIDVRKSKKYHYVSLDNGSQS